MEIVAEIDMAETGFVRASRPAEADRLAAGAGRVRRRAVVPFDARVPTVISTMPSGTAR
ncbi:hypothetical protein SAMN02745172_03846 [Pseudoxanthobacter soli DSM 19599]|uniref:Uncharacterized protein n=2 Tax=Pseudoxanthobacter TaxID=433838 RepID=A0A1M7ZQI3_9HYPH|nr:hypothetical protein SAMN02745172_03846 [Pseudoxanthobacter soli DSM 19599]